MHFQLLVPSIGLLHVELPDSTTASSNFAHVIELYTFNGLVEATTKYTTFANTGNEDNDKRELAAFLAQTAHESDSFRAAEEYNWQTYSVWQYCDNSTHACAPDRRNHGRGPIQLSWNYNYDEAGQALGVKLLEQPELVATDSAVSWMTALWFWMTPDGSSIHDVVAGPNGFAQATKKINGGLECGPSAPNQDKEQQRIAYFTKLCDALSVEPLGTTSCNA
ncbi:hypothetical protein PsorP6_015048 [Peronosclerospora sorghi]|uniref:Uncharacterized protein n=1 Tax=Peronosclerospora sorghi TaxID=230839 RepID=A0ACC0VSH2_9STRA|nr:hypothetical protein PsorP6_015048 [Peronosclerospora sorghi]